MHVDTPPPVWTVFSALPAVFTQRPKVVRLWSRFCCHKPWVNPEHAFAFRVRSVTLVYKKYRDTENRSADLAQPHNPPTGSLLGSTDTISLQSWLQA